MNSMNGNFAGHLESSTNEPYNQYRLRLMVDELIEQLIRKQIREVRSPYISPERRSKVVPINGKPCRPLTAISLPDLQVSGY
jgi:hypothetical protein